MKLLVCTALLAAVLVVVPPATSSFTPISKARVVLVLDDDGMPFRKMRRRKHYSPY